jgi:hypothetical protein
LVCGLALQALFACYLKSVFCTFLSERNSLVGFYWCTHWIQYYSTVLRNQEGINFNLLFVRGTKHPQLLFQMGRRVTLSRRKTPQARENPPNYTVKPIQWHVAGKPRRIKNRHDVARDLKTGRKSWKFSSTLSEEMMRHSFEMGWTVPRWVQYLHTFVPHAALRISSNHRTKRSDDLFKSPEDTSEEETSEEETSKEETSEEETSEDDDPSAPVQDKLVLNISEGETSDHLSDCEREMEENWDLDGSRKECDAEGDEAGGGETVKRGEVIEEGEEMEDGRVMEDGGAMEDEGVMEDGRVTEDVEMMEDGGGTGDGGSVEDGEEGPLFSPLGASATTPGAKGRKARSPVQFAMLDLDRLPEFVDFITNPCGKCAGKRVLCPRRTFRGLSLFLSMVCKGCSLVSHFSLLSNSILMSKIWCLCIVAAGLSYAHLHLFCCLIGLQNISESQFFRLQNKWVIPATQIAVDKRRELWVEKHKQTRFVLLTDARHAAIVNSDHNTTTTVLHDVEDISDHKHHHLFTFDVPREEASRRMAVQTDRIGLQKAFNWFEEKETHFLSVSFDDCSDNIPTLAPYQAKHVEKHGHEFGYFKDSWHKGKKLPSKLKRVMGQQWSLYSKNPTLQTAKYVALLSSLLPDKTFQISEVLLQALVKVQEQEKEVEVSKQPVVLPSTTNPTGVANMPTGVADMPTGVEKMKSLTKENVLQNTKQFPNPILQQMLKFMDRATTGKKQAMIDRIFTPAGVTISIPECLLTLKKKCTKAEGHLKTAQQRLAKVLAAEKKILKHELSDKGGRLSPHFHSCAVRCNGDTAEVLQAYLLNCLKHWGGDHSSCASESCQSEDMTEIGSNAIPLTHVLSFICLYFVFTTGRPGTNMTLNALKYYRKDIPTSICESFHSYLTFWAPKGINFSGSYKTRILIAELCWNDNQQRVRKLLARRKEPEKGKRVRGSIRSLWETPKNLDWVKEILSCMIDIGAKLA